MLPHKILFILPWLPYPLNSGGKQAIFNGIKAINKEVEIYITYPEDSQNTYESEKKSLSKELKGNITILPFTIQNPTAKKTIKERFIGRIHRELDKICPPRPKHTNPYSYWIEELLPKPKAFIDHVLSIIKQYDIEIVQCEMLRNLAFVHSLPSTVKTVFVHHEIGFVRHQLELESLTDDKFDGQAYMRSSQTLEISQLNCFDCIVTLSSIDSKKLIKAGVRTKIQDSFAIVNKCEHPQGASLHYNQLAFVGPDIHGPNYLGVKWFLENCWKKILAKDPSYHLTIIGKWTKQNIDAFVANYPNIAFLGFVENLEKALQDTIMIVPLTVGSGIRMKILEASNIGIPFVSTSIGAEGIPLISGTHCLIADSPDEFVDAIIQMQNKELRQTCIQNAHQLVEEHYSLSALTQNRLKIYDTLYQE